MSEHTSVRTRPSNKVTEFPSPSVQFDSKVGKRLNALPSVTCEIDCSVCSVRTTIT